MTPGRAVRCCLWLLAFSLALVGCSSHKSHRASPAARIATKTKVFRAYDRAGDLTVQVADVATGNCWTASIAARGHDAYRCISENQIFDPCFAAPKPATPPEVACIGSPWGRAEVLRLTGVLPSGQPP